MEPMGHRTQAPVTLRADTSPERVAIVTMRDCYRIGHYCVTLDSIISFFLFPVVQESIFIAIYAAFICIKFVLIYIPNTFVILRFFFKGTPLSLHSHQICFRSRV